MNEEQGKIGLTAESDKLKSEIEVSKQIVENTKKQYAEEIGNGSSISEMRLLAAVKPKTYKLPRKYCRNKRNGIKSFFEKIKILFGLEDEIR